MGCFTFIKVMMILFNLVIFLAGAVLLAVGIWGSVDGSSFVKLLESLPGQVTQVLNVGYLLIVIGAVLVLLGFLGCCGAQKESKCLLIMFFSIILIIFIAEIAAAVVVLVYSSFAESLFKSSSETTLMNQYDTNPVVTQVWNTTMTKLKCCGFNNYTDFTGSNYYNNHNGTYPPICCGNQTLPCTNQAAAGQNIQGCFKQLLSEIRNNANIVGGIAAGICALEVAAMVVSMYLYCHLDKNGN